jgi:DNA-binding CsgD family transcriptional regulator
MDQPAELGQQAKSQSDSAGAGAQSWVSLLRDESLGLAELCAALNPLIPHHSSACVLVRLCDCSVLKVIHATLSQQELRRYALCETTQRSDLLRNWHERHEPLVVECTTAIEETQDVRENPSRSVGAAIAVHGQVETHGTRAVVFVFGGVAWPPVAAHVETLKFVTPFLYSIAATSLRAHTTSRRGLTAREIEVLQWLSRGKTNDEIAMILSISEFTVRNHVRQILKKLHAENRTQAVLRGLERGLVG